MWDSDPKELQSAIEEAIGPEAVEYEIRFRPMASSMALCHITLLDPNNLKWDHLTGEIFLPGQAVRAKWCDHHKFRANVARQKKNPAEPVALLLSLQAS